MALSQCAEAYTDRGGGKGICCGLELPVLFLDSFRPDHGRLRRAAALLGAADSPFNQLSVLSKFFLHQRSGERISLLINHFGKQVT